MARLTVSFLESARADFREAVAWYRKNGSQRIAREFAVAVQTGVEQISIFPKSGSIFLDNVRRIYLNRFPFWLYYMELEGEIEVMGILHGKLDSDIHLGHTQ